MSNLPVVDNKFKLVQNITGAGTATTTLLTENSFVDKNIEFQTVTPQGVIGAGSNSISGSSDISGLLGNVSSSAPVSGHYVKIEGSVGVIVSTEGFVTTSDGQTITIADQYYVITEATQIIAGGTLTAGAGSTALVSDGLSNGSGTVDSTKKITLTTTDANNYYELEASGSGTVNRTDITSQVTQDGYIHGDASPVTQIAASSQTSNVATQKYYIKQRTISSVNVTPSTVQQTVTVSDGYSHESTTITINPTTSGSASSSYTDTGLSSYFNLGTSSSYDVSITPQHSIDVAGFLTATANPVDGTPSYYEIKEQTVTETTTTVNGTTATRGTRTEGVGWNSSSSTINTATFANSGSNGVTYVDISATTASPTLVSGDYLYVNKGWTDAVKISLAKLVPDGSNITGHADKIVTGYTAYNNDGSLVTGSLPVYVGAYVVS